MQEPLLTIIIPAYNASKYIRGCLNSILAQDCFPQSQVIVIDDGSKDSTAAIVRGYTLRYPNIELTCQPNSGVSVARNHGLDMARGEYISFVDADDMVGAVYQNCLPYLYDTGTPFYCGDMTIVYGQCRDNGPANPLGDNKYFSRLIDSARKNNAEIAFGGKISIHGELYSMSTLLYSNDSVMDSSPETKHTLLSQSDTRESANFAVYRRDLLNKHNLRFEPDMPLDEDILFCMLATLHANRVSTVRDSLYLYNRHCGSLTNYSDHVSSATARGMYSRAIIQRYGSFLSALAKYPQYAKTYKKYMREYCAMSYAGIRSHLRYFPLPSCNFCMAQTCQECRHNNKNLARLERGLAKLLPNRNQHTK